MRSEGRPKVDKDIFDIVEYDPTSEELERIEDNYVLDWKDELRFTKSHHHITKEKKAIKEESLSAIEEILEKPVLAPDDIKAAFSTIQQLLEQ